jgi:hypothetical protein
MRNRDIPGTIFKVAKSLFLIHGTFLDWAKPIVHSFPPNVFLIACVAYRLLEALRATTLD